jgi:hypothetical protein
MTIRWGSLVASPEGEIDYIRARGLVSILLALAGGLAVIAGLSGLLNAPTDIVMIGVGALVLPLTGGKIAEGIASRLPTTVINNQPTGGNTPSIP